MNETEGHMGKCGNSSITVLENRVVGWQTYTYWKVLIFLVPPKNVSCKRSQPKHL